VALNISSRWLLSKFSGTISVFSEKSFLAKEAVGLSESKRKMGWARTDFAGFAAPIASYWSRSWGNMTGLA